MSAPKSDLKTLVPSFTYGSILPTKDHFRRGDVYQFYRLVPLDVMYTTVGLGITDYTREGVDQAIGNFDDCVAKLQQEKVDRIVLEGVPISAQLGRSRTLELLDRAEQKTGIPTDGPLESIIASMNHLGLTRLSVGSRWTEELNSALSRYLKEGDIEVVSITDRGQWAKEAFGMSFEEGLEKALEVGREAAADDNAEAVFVAGGAAMSLHVIPIVEKESNKPVFTNLTVQIWNGLVRTGVIDPVEGWGKLLASK